MGTCQVEPIEGMDTRSREIAGQGFEDHGRVVAMVWEGQNVVNLSQQITQTKNHNQKDNKDILSSEIVQVSENAEQASKQIAKWFGNELFTWLDYSNTWTYE